MAEPVKEASRFVPITGVNTTLESKLGRLDKQLPIPLTPTQRKLLAGGAFTFLTISNDVDMEVVKAYLFDDKLLIERGQDGTDATAFPAGSCVTSQPTWAGIKELICTLDCCEDGGE